MNETEIIQQTDAELEHIHRLGAGRRLGVIAGVMIAGALPEVVSKTAEMAGVISRDVLPEPWDLPDHVGNFNEGALYTTFVYSLARMVMSRRRHGEVSPTESRKIALGAVGVSSVIQLVGEGFSVMNHGDMTDAAYGIGFSGVAAVALHKGYQWVDRFVKQKSEDVIQKEKETLTRKPYRTRTTSADSPVKALTLPGLERTPVAEDTRPNKVDPRAKKNKRKQQQQSRKKNR